MPPRSVRLVFTGIWLVAWLAAILVGCALLVSAIAEGSYGPVPILAIWLAGAAFFLWRVSCRFAEGLAGQPLGPARRRTRSRRRWLDGLVQSGGDSRDQGELGR